MKHQNNKDQAGYTLVEILVALLIGAIMFGAAAVIINNQTHLNQRSRDLVIANAFAEAKVEALRSAGFANINDGVQDITNELPSELKSPRTGTLTVTTPDTGMKKLDVSITYNDQGKQRTESYTTYLGELGVGQQ